MIFGRTPSTSAAPHMDETPPELAQNLKDLARSDGEDFKRFEAVSKHYHDIFNYHAGQRLTAFNFFVISLSFFSNGYATLVTKGKDDPRYLLVAAGLSVATYLLVISFGRLDKRNEQIILIDERPIKRIQQIFAARYGGDEWQTFLAMDNEAKPFRTFGRILPRIYTLGATLAAAGAMASLFLDDKCSLPVSIGAWIGASAFAGCAIDRWPRIRSHVTAKATIEKVHCNASTT